jgi:hypothetical protein
VIKHSATDFIFLPLLWALEMVTVRRPLWGSSAHIPATRRSTHLVLSAMLVIVLFVAMWAGDAAAERSRPQPVSPASMGSAYGLESESTWSPPVAAQGLRSVSMANRRQELMELLFPPIPNRSRFLPSPTNAANSASRYHRNLYGEFIPNSAANCPLTSASGTGTNKSVVPCPKCANLVMCKIINGRTIQEVYYPLNIDLRGTCTIIEELAVRMSLEIFGVGKTFRDTPECRGATVPPFSYNTLSLCRLC